MKKKSDVVIIREWIENMERCVQVHDFELGGSGTSSKMFKSTGLANAYEIETGDGTFTCTFTRKV